MVLIFIIAIAALCLAYALDNRVTNSQLNTAATCLRKHQWAYVAGIRPGSEATPLRMGTAWHAALDRRAAGIPLETNVEQIRGEYELRKTGGERDYWLDIEAEVIVRLLVGYDWRWAEMDAAMQVVATELPFEVPIVNPETGRSSRTYVYAGKIDKLMRLADSRLSVMEHKSSGHDIDPLGDYWKRLRIDSQIARYVLGARQLGHPIETVLYDVVRKPSIQPRQIPVLDEEGVKIVRDATGERVRTKDGKKWRESADAAQGFVLETRPETPTEYGERIREDMGAQPDRYFQRREIPRTEQDLKDAAEDLWDMAQILGRCDSEGRWPKNSTSCIGFGRCQYFDLCTTGRSPLDDQVPEGFVRVDDVHQELVEAANG